MSLLAAADPASAGPIGLFIVLLLGVVTVLLIRSMNGRLRRLPTSFRQPPVASPAPPPPASPLASPTPSPPYAEVDPERDEA